MVSQRNLWNFPVENDGHRKDLDVLGGDKGTTIIGDHKAHFPRACYQNQSFAI